MREKELSARNVNYVFRVMKAAWQLKQTGETWRFLPSRIMEIRSDCPGGQARPYLEHTFLVVLVQIEVTRC